MSSKLYRITFTGVDEKTDLGALRAITSERCYPPYVEFAALWSLSRSGTYPRYPSREWFDQCDKQVVQAIHLCGREARATAESGKFSIVAYNVIHGFRRCQVNATKYDYLNLARSSRNHNIQIIVQDREDPVNWCPGLAVLHDSSGGRGESPERWPPPSKEWGHEECVGYAGGLGPDNLRKELPIIAEARGNGPFAIDMESGVRTNDWFDVSKVLEALKIIDEFWPPGR